MAEPLTAEQIASLHHEFMGPSWEKNEDGSWRLPEHTLGWQILGWATEYLLDVAGSGAPLELTPEQARLLLWWYAIDENGDFLYTQGCIARVKGWGKDPFLSVICAIEFIGPCRFSHWNENGEPVAKSHPNSWVQIAAVARDQTQNTTEMFPVIFSERAISEYRIKPGIEIWRAREGRSKIEITTSSPRKLEGNRPSFSVIGEPHHMVKANKGYDSYRAIARNLSKTGSRLIAITNAFQPGEGSVAEVLREGFDAIREGRRSPDPYFRLMYDSIEANASTPLTPEALEIVLPIVRGDSYWLKPEGIMADIFNPTTPPSESRRFYLNQVVADEETLVSQADWRPLLREGQIIEPGEMVTLGFDGGKSDDATALVAMRVSDGHTQLIGLWERPDSKGGEGWEVPRESVDSAVRAAFQTYRVVGFFADVAYWESYIASWSRDYREQLVGRSMAPDGIGWDMRALDRNKTMAHERLLASIFSGAITHDGDFRLARHVYNARRKHNNWGVWFTKDSPESPRKVDAYSAMLLAHEARYTYMTGRKPNEKKAKSGRSWIL